MYRHENGWLSRENQCSSVSYALLTIALYVIGGVSAHADHPTPQAITTERPENDLLEAARTPTGKIAWEFCCLGRTNVKPFEDPKTKAVVLIFISPDCPIANAYHPQLKQLDERLGPQGIRFFLVHSSRDISTIVARKHAETFDLSLPVVLDADQSIARAVNATITPEAVVLARRRSMPIYRGAIDNRYAGYGKKRRVVNQFFLNDALISYLAGESIAVPKTVPIGCFISFDDPNPKRSHPKRASRQITPMTGSPSLRKVNSIQCS